MWIPHSQLPTGRVWFRLCIQIKIQHLRLLSLHVQELFPVTNPKHTLWVGGDSQSSFYNWGKRGPKILTNFLLISSNNFSKILLSLCFFPFKHRQWLPFHLSLERTLADCVVRASSLLQQSLPHCPQTKAKQNFNDFPTVTRLWLGTEGLSKSSFIAHYSHIGSLCSRQV